MEERLEGANLNKEEILQRIKENEVYGMGGAAFSTYQKIATVMSSKQGEKHFIINGAECDPGLIHDHLLLKNYSAEINRGIEFVCKCVDFTSVHLAVKDIKGLRFSEHIQITQIPDFYPVGAEKILIAEVLNKQISYDEIPSVYGILVLNIQTLYSIYETVCKNEKADSKFLTVSNLREKSASVVKVSLGTKIQEVMEAIYPGTNNIFVGGGLMQSAVADDEAIVDKNINLITTALFPKYKESPQCSKCGNCSRNCPAGLLVNRIADLVDLGKLSLTKKYHVRECIGCGSCSYSCLAGRNLSSRVKAAKEYLN